MFGLHLITAADSAPITRAIAKAHCRYTDDDKDDLFDLYIIAGVAACERIAGIVLISQTLKLTAQCWADVQDEFGRIPIPLMPLQSVSEFAYLDADGDTQTIDADDYLVETGHQPGLLMLGPDVDQPTLGSGYPNALQITFVAGYGDSATDVPADIRVALLNYVSYRFYEDAEPDEDLLVRMFAGFRLDGHT